MSARRKISVRKIIQTLVTLVAVSGCALAMMSADKQQVKRTVKEVKYQIKSPHGVRFLTDEDVTSILFQGRHIVPTDINLNKLDEKSMEAILASNPWVKNAEVYVDADRTMHIGLVQRVPVVRLFEEDGNSYYLDAALKSMPLSTQYTHYTPVVTGVPKLFNDSGALITKGKVVGLVRKIHSDSFWSAQVSQINMRADGGFELMPVLGKQRIILGDTTQLESKLNALLEFYKQVQNKVGWDKYNTIDLRYNGQVVASPSLPWKAPVDRALSNMNWLKAIMENAPARQAQLGGDAATNSDPNSTTVSAVQSAKPQSTTATLRTTKPGTETAGPSISEKSPKSSNSVLSAAAKPKKQTTSVKPVRTQNTQQKQTPKNTTRHKQNSPPHAATNR